MADTQTGLLSLSALPAMPGLGQTRSCDDAGFMSGFRLKPGIGQTINKYAA
jgi:hypothetical protein